MGIFPPRPIGASSEGETVASRGIGRRFSFQIPSCVRNVGRTARNKRAQAKTHGGRFKDGEKVHLPKVPRGVAGDIRPPGVLLLKTFRPRTREKRWDLGVSN